MSVTVTAALVLWIL